MKIEKGFEIDKPNVFVPWNIKENELVELFAGLKLKNVTNGYYTISCESLDGLKCLIGFHFEPRKNGVLNELEFFRADYIDQRKSFNNFQTHFEKIFGIPTAESEGSDGFNNYEWYINGVRIMHYVFDRFGSEEHMIIKYENISKYKVNFENSVKAKKNIYNELWSKLKSLWS